MLSFQDVCLDICVPGLPAMSLGYSRVSAAMERWGPEGTHSWCEDGGLLSPVSRATGCSYCPCQTVLAITYCQRPYMEQLPGVLVTLALLMTTSCAHLVFLGRDKCYCFQKALHLGICAYISFLFFFSSPFNPCGFEQVGNVLGLHLQFSDISS